MQDDDSVTLNIVACPYCQGAEQQWKLLVGVEDDTYIRGIRHVACGNFVLIEPYGPWHLAWRPEDGRSELVFVPDTRG